MRKEVTYWQTKGGELLTSAVFYDDDGHQIATSGGDRPRNAKKLSKTLFDAALRRQAEANDQALAEAEERRQAERVKADAESAERAAAVRSWLEQMDAPPEVIDALSG